jgi:hypothetical protein
MDQRIAVARLNIEHFLQPLADEPDGPRRDSLLRLLAQKDAQYVAEHIKARRGLPKWCLID